MNPFRTRLIAMALTPLAGLALLTGNLRGQAAPAATDPAAPKKLDVFVVTGSYIPSTETAVEAGPSPVLRLDRKAIEESGATGTAELLQKIGVTNAGSVPISNNALGFTPGASAISLRGLGPEATLVLINGRRVAPYPVGAGGTTAFVDLNTIPLSTIDSIEVLKDGASALYGADAVAGVVNLKLRRGMAGSELLLTYGNTTNKDSSELVASIATGATTEKVSLIVAFNFYRKGAIMDRDRDYSAAPPFLSANSSPFNLLLSRFAVANALGQPVAAPIRGVSNFALAIFGQSGADAANNGQRPASQYTYSGGRSSAFNPNEFTTSYPDVRRTGAMVFGERKAFGTDNVKAYGDLSFQMVDTEYQLAPTATGDFSTPGQVDLIIPARTAAPILTVEIPVLGGSTTAPAGAVIIPGLYFAGPGTRFVNNTVQRLAAPGAFNPFNPFNQDISDDSRGRLVEFGNRIVRNATEAVMVTAGIKGENVAGKWNFDASLSYSSITDRTSSRFDSATRFNEVVNANSPIFDPRSPRYIGTTTPYNPFGYFRNPNPANALLADYVHVTVRDENESSLAQLNAVGSTRELFALPHGPVGLAFGGDFRREQLKQNPSAYGVAGDIIGSAPSAFTRAQRKVAGLFVETRLPILPRLEAGASVRHEIFFTSDREVTVPKGTLRWQPVARELTLRSSYSRGFREPSLYELYSSPVSVLSPILDPRDFFLEPEQSITLRGNRRLKAEKTDYFNAGFVWSPARPGLKGLTLGADFWAITRKGTVRANPQNTVLRAFGVGGAPLPGESVTFTSSGAIGVVNSLFYNVGQTEVEGWDFSAGYALPTDAIGRFELSTVWTLITRFEQAAVEGVPLRRVLGLDATGTGADGYLKLKGRVNLNWAYKGFSTYLGGSYIDGFDDTDANFNFYHVRARFITDAQVSYAFRGAVKPALRDTRINLGVRNLADWDPPQAYGNGGNSSGYPGAIYTSEGRFVYFSANRKF